VIRSRLAPAREEERLGFATFLNGSYYLHAMLAAAFLAAALMERLSGPLLTFALLLEAELAFLAGYTLQRPFIRRLGGAALALPLFRLLAVDIFSKDQFIFAGREWHSWMPVAVLIVAALMLNRLLTKGGWLYALAATIVTSVIFSEELPKPWAAVAWAALGLGTLVIGIRRGQRDLRLQSYLVAAAVLVRVLMVNVDSPVQSTRVLTIGLVVSFWYLSQFVLRSTAMAERYAKLYFSVLATSLLTVIVFLETSGRLLTVVFGMEGVALLAAGFMVGERILRISGLAVFLLCIGKLFLHDLNELDTLSRILSFIVLGVMLLAMSWLYTRYREKLRKLL
jgi:hypothetical protein